MAIYDDVHDDNILLYSDNNKILAEKQDEKIFITLAWHVQPYKQIDMLTNVHVFYPYGKK